MSQTETLMLVALGFVLALIVALLFGRAIWNVAIALGARRNAKNVPVQMLELQADRDRLRAEHAMMSRKLELRLEDIKARMTEQMAEVSRSRNRVQSLAQQLDERESTLSIRDREVAALSSQVELQRNELDTGASILSRLTTDNATKDIEIAKLSQTVSQLTLNLREKNGMVSRLSEELQTSLRNNAPISTDNTNSDNGEDRIKRRIAELTTISAQLSEQHSHNTQTIGTTGSNIFALDPPSRQSALNDRMADTEREAEAMTLELKSLDVMLDQRTKVAPIEPAPARTGARANIISLAQRIRALQGNEGK